MARIGMIGAGSWGTALAAHLARCGHKVEVWSIMKDETDMINNTHQQSVKLPGVVLDDSVTASTDLEEVMRDKDMLVLAVGKILPVRPADRICSQGDRRRHAPDDVGGDQTGDPSL